MKVLKSLFQCIILFVSYIKRFLFSSNLASSSSFFFFFNYSAKFSTTKCSTTVNGYSSIEKQKTTTSSSSDKTSITTKVNIPSTFLLHLRPIEFLEFNLLLIITNLSRIIQHKIIMTWLFYIRILMMKSMIIQFLPVKQVHIRRKQFHSGQEVIHHQS